MNALRRGYELESLFWGRPVRPFHLAVTIATSVVGFTNVFAPGAAVITGGIGLLLGLVALLSASLLVVGWWFRNEWCAEWGLLIAVGVWTARVAYIGLTGEGALLGSEIAAMALSAAWVVGAGGAYLLERYDHETADANE